MVTAMGSNKWNDRSATFKPKIVDGRSPFSFTSIRFPLYPFSPLLPFLSLPSLSLSLPAPSPALACPHLLSLPLLSPLLPSLSSPPLRSRPLIQLGVWGSAVNSPAGSGAEPQPKLNLVHCSFKTLYDIWWQQF